MGHEDVWGSGCIDSHILDLRTGRSSGAQNPSGRCGKEKLELSPLRCPARSRSLYGLRYPGSKADFGGGIPKINRGVRPSI
jgi:hypothetical protein